MLISVSSKAQIVPRAEPPTACSVCTLFLAPSIKQLHYSLMFQKTWDQNMWHMLMCWLYFSNTINLHWCAGPLLPCVLGTKSFAALYLRECGSAHVLVILIGVLVHYCLVF